MHIVITNEELIAVGMIWIVLLIIIAFFRAKKKGTSSVGSREENLKTAFEEFEKTAGDALVCISVSGVSYGKKVKFDRWSESEINKLVELGYRWFGDEWVKDNPRGLYDEFKSVEKLLGGGIRFYIQYKPGDISIARSEDKVFYYAQTKWIGFRIEMSEDEQQAFLDQIKQQKH
jgi:hypothetical protein